MPSLMPRFAFRPSAASPTAIDGAVSGQSAPPAWSMGPWLYLGLLTAVFLLVALAALVRILPWWPEFGEPNLDASWTRVLQEGFLAGTSFGRDLVFTYGPWAFVVRNLYHPALYGEMMVLRGLLVLIMTMSTWRVGLGLSSRPWIRVFLAAGLCLLTTELLAQCAFTECMYYLLAWYVALFWMVLEGESDGAAATGAGLAARVRRFLPRAHEHLLIAAAAFLTVTKFSYAMAILAAMAGVTLKTALGRRLPRVLFLYAAEVILFWLLADQPLSGLPYYFWNSFQVARGYGGMQLAGPSWYIICFILAFALLIAAIAQDRWRTERWQALVGLPLLALLAMVLGKASFVRHEVCGHGPIGTYAAATICLATACALCRRKTDRRTKLLLCASLTAAVALILPLWLVGSSADVAALYPGRDGHRRSLRACCLQSLHRAAEQHLRQWTVAGMMVRGQVHLQAIFEQSEARARELYRLPPLVGAIDVYPELGSIVYSQGARYQPRPTIQSYVATTWRLAGMNAAHLRSSKAPDWILFSLAPFEGRFPSLQDSLSWPEFLSRYEIQPMDAPIAKRGYLLLKKSEKARPYEFVHLAAHRVPTGEPLPDVPGVAEGPIWVSLRIKLSTPGKVAEAALKIPRVYLECVTQSGCQGRYRFDPGTAAAGFLLSPLVADTAGYQWLAVALADEASWRKAAPQERAVKSLRVVAPHRWAYGDTVEVDYYRLRLASSAPDEPALQIARRK